MMNNRLSGHTVLELMVVVAVIAIITAVAVPYMGAYSQGGRVDELKATVLKVAAAQERFYTTNNRYASREIDLSNYGLPSYDAEMLIKTGIVFIRGVGPVYFVSGSRNADRGDSDLECWVYFGHTPSGSMNANLVQYTSDDSDSVTVDLSSCPQCPTVANACTP